jgi:hypothetical protein
MTDNNAQRCLAICPLFEAELLLELMLINWEHPFAQEESFRQALLESGTELLMAASDDACTEVFIEGLPTREMNLVSAVWYAEWCGVQDDNRERELRQKWLSEVRRALPSCFCPTDLLDNPTW